MSLLDVLIGAGVSITTTLSASWTKVKLSKTEATEQRRSDAREYRRDCLVTAQSAAANYRKVLVELNGLAVQNRDPSEALAAELRSTRIEYEAVIHRIDRSLWPVADEWATFALGWGQGEGSAEDEQKLWAKAMKRLSEQIKREL